MKPVADYRVQLWVNGYMFGKYVNNIGPQTSFPVPQGKFLVHSPRETGETGNRLMI